MPDSRKVGLKREVLAITIYHNSIHVLSGRYVNNVDSSSILIVHQTTSKDELLKNKEDTVAMRLLYKNALISPVFLIDT